jgi:hypothetical protein
MAQGMWQYVTPDGDIHASPFADLLGQILANTQNPLTIAGEYANDHEAFMRRAETVFGKDVTQLFFYMSSMDAKVITFILADEELALGTKIQPKRLQWQVWADSVTGLITASGVQYLTRSQFPGYAPVSRLP